MTYGFRPENWSAFQAELQKRGIAVTDIERVEIRPGPENTEALDTGVGTAIVDIMVTLRSGRLESWRQRRAEGGLEEPT